MKSGRKNKKTQNKLSEEIEKMFLLVNLISIKHSIKVSCRFIDIKNCLSKEK